MGTTPGMESTLGTNGDGPSADAALPEVSVVIPTLNEADAIAHAVERALALRPREVVVADGGSDDGTAEIARRAGAVVVVGERGRGPQLNTGANAADGGVLLFLHADTFLASAAVRHLRRAIDDPAVVWGAFRQRIDARGWRYRALEAGNAWRARWLGAPYGDQGMFVRSEAFDAAGRFPDQPLMEDLHLACRLRRQSGPVLLAGPLHTSARRWQRNGVVWQTAKNWAFVAMWTAGVSPVRLARWYRPHNRDAAGDDRPELARQRPS